MPLLVARLLAAAAAAATHASVAEAEAEAAPVGRIRAWHITDPHVDPFYRAGTPTEGCYCRCVVCARRPHEPHVKVTGESYYS